MSGFENVVSGKLKLKGKALDVKAGGMKKKKKLKKNISLVTETELSVGEGAGMANESNKEEATNEKKMGGEEKEVATNENKMGGEEKAPSYDHHLTPAERCYIEQRERIYVKRLAKTANKSHRDRIQDFNQYLANMSEHYDIPKVGPG